MCHKMDVNDEYYDESSSDDLDLSDDLFNDEDCIENISFQSNLLQAFLLTPEEF